MEGKIVVYTACNNGSSSVISKDGELYMFGKDAIYSDSSSKLNTVSLLCTESPVLDIVYCNGISRKLTLVACFLYDFQISFQMHLLFLVLLLGTLSLVSGRANHGAFLQCGSTLAITFSVRLSVGSCDLFLVVPWGHDFHNLADL